MLALAVFVFGIFSGVRVNKVRVSFAVTLGAVLSLDESGGYRPQPMFAQADMARSMPVAEGTMSLGAQVQIVYAIE